MAMQNGDVLHGHEVEKRAAAGSKDSGRCLKREVWYGRICLTGPRIETEADECKEGG